MSNKLNAASIIPDHSGDYYSHILRNIHNFLSPKTYLEIGTLAGETLALAKCNAVAVDPSFKITQDVISGKPSCHLMQTTSDEFFKNFTPRTFLGSEIEMAFLDGMHWFEFLLRDFINVEKNCRRNSIIAIHDCIPTEIHVARRNPEDSTFLHGSRHAEWWAGDVWKAISILKSMRPELSVRAYDAPPTGLILVTNLDPTNRSLEENYFKLVERMSLVQCNDDSLGRYFESLSIEPTSSIDTYSKMTQFYWL